MTDREFDQLLQEKVVVIYDGVCGFCNSSLQFILKQKPSKKLRFVSFQSELGNRIRTYMNMDEDMDSIIVVENNDYRKKSKAIFRILNHIESNWKYLKYFSFVPLWISDFVYEIIAQNRYRIQKTAVLY